MIIARVPFNIKRDSSSYIKFDSVTSGIILKMKGFFGKTLPLGNRIYGPIAREVRVYGFRKVVSLATISL